MEIETKDEYRNGSFYKRESDLTYSNRFTKEDKQGAIFICVFCYSIVAALSGGVIYGAISQSVIWPIFLIPLGLILPGFIAAVVTDNLRKMLTYRVSIELNESGFIQTIKNIKTHERKDFYLPFKTMESVTMGRHLHLVRGRKSNPGTYWLSIELAMKGKTSDGKIILKRFTLKNPDEIQLWIEKFQQNQIPIYYMDRLLKDLTLEDYEKIEKVPYPEETGEILLAYKTDGQKAPLNWDGKKIYP